MQHVPVMLQECIEGLAVRPGGVYVDGTLGRGGHSEAIARLLTDGRLIGIDRDPQAIREAGERLAPFGDRVTLVHGRFSELERILKDLGIGTVDGMLFDLGVSSPQLDDGARGFSYRIDAPLDMRMDPGAGLTAFDVVNEWPADRLKKILYEYGEERYAPAVSAAICRSRKDEPIRTTLQLAEIVRRAMPPQALREKQHPAKRTFQAIRIAVNDELTELSEMLAAAPDLLNTGGRLCVISFHSLEDRIVKNAIASREKGCTCPKEFPVCICGFKQTLRSVTRKPIQPTKEETEENPRARSARLRIAQRV
ncbi:MAG: 16S rRNA (cytosine(1402)-N(4))-methyltransferase RsmH [Oscillospiraceae bacterium]|nr:16S rRNA (cytosine(1402)-N(4))-methyltransferase RsmH [Oscillospiraceae bacterium]